MLKDLKSPWLLLILAFTLIIYWPGLAGGFHFDDNGNVVDNPMIYLTALDLENLAMVWNSGFSSPSGRPLSMLSFALNWYVGELDPWGFKATNLILHCLNGVLLFCLLRVLTQANQRLERPTPAHWFVPVVTLIWLAHPFNLSPVLYIVQRMASLAAFFALASLLVYALGRQRQLAGRSGWHLILAALIIGTPLSYLSKETGVLLPWLIVAVEWFIFRFKGADDASIRPLIRLHQVIVLVPLSVAAAVVITNPGIVNLGYEMRHFDMTERLLTQSRVLWFYLQQTLFPNIDAMGLFHDDFIISRGLTEPWTTLPAILGLIALVVLAMTIRNHFPFVGLGIAIFLIGHSLEAGPLALEMVHEHRNYLPSAGPIIALVSVLAATQWGEQLRRIVPVFLGALIVLNAFSLTIRIADWKTPFTLTVAQVARHPDSARSQYELARILSQEYAANPGRPELIYETALSALVRASELDPTGLMPPIGVVLLNTQAQKDVPERWLQILEKNLLLQSHTPKGPAIIDSLLSCYRTESCPIDQAKMDSYFRIALKNPQIKGKAEAIWQTRYARFLLQSVGASEKALALMEQADKNDPESIRTKQNHLLIVVASGHLEKANTLIARYREIGVLDALKVPLNHVFEFLNSVEGEQLTQKEAMHRWGAFIKKRNEGDTP